MRYPRFLSKNGTIGFVAPAFGCAQEPYYSAFTHALERFHAMGYGTRTGFNWTQRVMCSSPAAGES